MNNHHTVWVIHPDTMELRKPLYTGASYEDAHNAMAFLMREKGWPFNRLSIVCDANGRHCSVVVEKLVQRR